MYIHLTDKDLANTVCKTFENRPGSIMLKKFADRTWCISNNIVISNGLTAKTVRVFILDIIPVRAVCRNFAKGVGELGYVKKRGAQLQAALGRELADNV